MSLINDALKKAQRQRTEGNSTPAETTAPGAAAEELHRVARRAKPAGFRSQLILIGGGAVVTVIVLGLVAMFYFRSGNQPVAASSKPVAVAAAPAPVVASVAVQPAPATVAPAPSPAVTAPASVTVPPAPNTVAVVTAPAPAPQPVIAAAVPVANTPAVPPSNQFALPAPVPAVATASNPPAAAGAPSDVIVLHPKPSTRMIGVIEHFRIGGIRMAGPDSKVLMNDKVYRLNDIVDYELNIRLTGIETKALTFEDSHGAIHVRTF